jgi:hypothetical protein
VLERSWRTCAALCLLVGLLLTGLAPAASTADERRASASLTITPADRYVGGQALVFAGNIGATGARELHLQLNADYSGGVWGDVAGFRATTRENGDFSFVFPAPAMKGIRYRVASGKLATPYVTFHAKSQDLTVTPAGTPRAGLPFELLVDTTPDLVRRPDTIGLRPLPGRTLILQERVSPTRWKELDTTEVGLLGLASFTLTEPVGGVHVYRVVADDMFDEGNRIGWFPSFPTYVDVRGTSSAKDPEPDRSSLDPTSTRPPTTARISVGSGDRTTASRTYRWGVSLFDFAWVFGESLSAKPHRGSVLKGSWTEYSDGGGRVTSHNGGLYFASKRDNKAGPGDFGTTMATLKGNPRTYGRWEVRVRARSEDTDGKDYAVRAELVPANPEDYDCGAHNITMGELTAHGSTILFGANADDRRWTHRRSVGGSNNVVSYNLATEVSRRHITWFVNGKPVATVKSRKAVSDLPMTLRISMVGDGRQEMNHTDVLSDWQRGFSLRPGTKVTSGRKMSVGSHETSC